MKNNRVTRTNPRQSHNKTTEKMKVGVYLHGDTSSGSSEQRRFANLRGQELVP